VKPLNWAGGLNFPGKKRTPSLNPVFGIFPENATFQPQVFNLVQKSEVVSKGKKSLDNISVWSKIKPIIAYP